MPCTLSRYGQRRPSVVSKKHRRATDGSCRSNPLRKHMPFVIEAMRITRAERLPQHQCHAPDLPRYQLRKFVGVHLASSIAIRTGIIAGIPAYLNPARDTFRYGRKNLSHEYPAVWIQPRELRHSELDPCDFIFVR